MKKIAILTSVKIKLVEALAKRLQTQKVQITCVSDIENNLLKEKAQQLQIDYNFIPQVDFLDYFSKNKFDLIALVDFQSKIKEEVLEKMGTVINVHPSLLPSFKGENAVQKAFLSGVKVSGITIHYVQKNNEEDRIITQYPVFIENAMRLDEFEEAISTIENKLYPIVIEKMLADEIFDFQDLMKSSCDNKSCGGCSSDSKSGGCSGCKEK